MKSLHTIQTLSKIGKILSKIVYICCIVGFCGCLVGALALIFCKPYLAELFAQEQALGSVWYAIFAGFFLSAGEFVVSLMAHRYFRNELAAGTPFTVQGAKELLRLGIYVIWIPLAGVLLTQIAQGVIGQFYPVTTFPELNGFESVGEGVALILVSLLCRYGAELTGASEQ